MSSKFKRIVTISSTLLSLIVAYPILSFLFADDKILQVFLVSMAAILAYVMGWRFSKRVIHWRDKPHCKMRAFFWGMLYCLFAVLSEAFIIGTSLVLTAPQSHTLSKILYTIGVMILLAFACVLIAPLFWLLCIVSGILGVVFYSYYKSCNDRA